MAAAPCTRSQTDTSAVTARAGMSAFQRLLAVAVVALAAVCCLLEPRTAWGVANLLLFLLFAGIVAGKMLTVLAGLFWRDVETVAAEALAAADWPVYTVLVPLYHEATVVPGLLTALEALDYPRDRLDVILLLEADDAETAAALASGPLPPWIQVRVVPPGEPRTKPRACNAGLAVAKGEFLVVFDAEDRPDPDQLKKAVAVFRRLPPRVACLQARLDFYNASQNLLTRWFTLEYTTWFDLYLPGLHTLRAPIPLGGTSNHFRTQMLRDVGSWDPWNVTEDCDLGMRLARCGKETRILDATTWEEATSAAGPWLRQRSRWVKGYWQTLVAHTASPVPALCELGPWKLLQFLLVVGGQVVSLVLNPVCLLLLLAWLWWRWPIFCPDLPLTAVFFVGFVVMLLCNLLFVAVHALGVLQRGRLGLLLDSLLLPVYWLLMSAGAWRGVTQFFFRPFTWEKTPHGMAAVAATSPAHAAADSGPGVRRRLGPVGRRARLQTVVVLVLLGGVLAWVAVQVPRWLQFERQIRLAKLGLSQPGAEVIRDLDHSWVDRRILQVAVNLPPEAPRAGGVYKAVVYLKVLDWDWYQITTTDCRRDGSLLRVSVSLDAGAWEPRRTRRPWGPWCLRRVRGLGVRVFGEEKDLGLVAIRGLVAAEQVVARDLQATLMAVPAATQQHRMDEVRFRLSHEYANPFDPAEIEVTAVVRPPAGAETRVTAFYGQDYRRHVGPENVEKLVADGAPYWAVRYTPQLPGRHSWALAGKDRHGNTFRQPLPDWDVAPAPGRGSVCVDAKDPRYFAFSNGDFFYPLAINVRSPGDTVQPRGRDYVVPADAEGTWAMERYFDRMAAAGINMARVWCAPWFGGLEWNREAPGYHGLGLYNLQNAWRLDCLLELARARGLWLELALQSHGPFTFQYDVQWPENPYNRALGGPLSHPEEVLTNPEALRLFRNRFRYTAARYGAHPNLFAWTLWIEVDAVTRNGAILKQWHENMIPWLQQHDAGRHPVSTEFQSAYGYPEVFALPGIAFTQLAAYNWVYDPMLRLRQAAYNMDRFPKPRLIEEYGGTSDGGSMPLVATEIHDGLWGGWMLPLSATPMPWWWNFIFAKDLDRFYKVFSRYIAGEDLRGTQPRLETVPLANGRGLEAWVRRGPDHAFAWVRPRYVPAIDPKLWHDWRPLPLKEEPARSPSFDPVSGTQPKRFAAVTGAVLELRGLDPGRYAGTLWETWGVETVTPVDATVAADGTLRLELPPLERDLALKLRKVPAPAGR